MTGAKRYIRNHSVLELVALCLVPFAAVLSLTIVGLVLLALHLLGTVGDLQTTVDANAKARIASFDKVDAAQKTVNSKLSTLQSQVNRGAVAQDIDNREQAALVALVVREGGNPAPILQQFNRERQKAGITGTPGSPNSAFTPAPSGSRAPTPMTPTALPTAAPSATSQLICVPLVHLCL